MDCADRAFSSAPLGDMFLGVATTCIAGTDIDFPVVHHHAR